MNKIDYPAIILDLGQEKNEYTPSKVLLQRKEDSYPVSTSIAEFEEFFHLRYRPFLTFSNRKSLKKVIRNCPHVLRYQWFAEDNYILTALYKDQLFKGLLAPVSVRWVNSELGYGLFAEADFIPGTYIGEYVGIVRPISRNHLERSAYLFHYPTKWWSKDCYAIDSMSEGNLMRFLNHSNMPNVKPVCLVNQNLLHIVFIADQHIPCGSQLTFNYGSNYRIKSGSLPMNH